MEASHRFVVDEGVRGDGVDEDVVGKSQLLEVVGQVDLQQQQRKLTFEDVGHQVMLKTIVKEVMTVQLKKRTGAGK